MLSTASDGDCNYAFHTLLTDSVICNGGTKTLLEILNRFGITTSSSVANANMNMMVDKKKVENDF